MKHARPALLVCTLLFSALCIGTNAAQASDREQPYTGVNHPQNAAPGEVWCLFTIPATMRTVSEQCMVTPATCTYEVIPAVFSTRTEQVLCTPECKRRIEIPAVYRTEEYQACVKKESCRTEVIPAVYGTRSEEVLCRPESKRRIDIPAVYRTEEFQVEACHV